MKKILIMIGLGISNIIAQTNQQPPLIPLPEKITMGTGSFQIDGNTKIIVDDSTSETGTFIGDHLRKVTGYPFPVHPIGTPENNSIVLKLDPGLTTLGNEGYTLNITSQNVIISTLTIAGAFYGAQTLRQLLPVQIEAGQFVSGVTWSVPQLSIEDKPRFSWRGYLLDPARHFWSVDFVKRLIDQLAYFKMNRLQLHLTDDQGWRIEIKSRPNLTVVGAYRDDGNGGKYGGFYSQIDIAEIVAHAAKRHLVLVPEIEMPGHGTAAGASYNELTCHGNPVSVQTNWGIFPDIFCACKEGTYDFLGDVLNEVAGLFPGPWIHIGGDEAPKGQWQTYPPCQQLLTQLGLSNYNQLQSQYFNLRIQDTLKNLNKIMIGWDEILEGGKLDNAIITSWRGEAGGIEAVSLDMNAIMSPYTDGLYLDYDYNRSPLSQSYSYNPIPAAVPSNKSHLIMGLQGNLWTERIPTEDRADYQGFPRTVAIAEVGWSPLAKKDWNDFSQRIGEIGARMELMGIQFYQTPEVNWTLAPVVPKDGNLAAGKNVTVSTELNGFDAINTTDSRSSTRWAATGGNNDWIVVDLGSNHDVNRVVINWEDAFASQYRIELSIDNVNWITVYTEVNGNGGLDEITFNPANARYIKMQGIQRGSSFPYSIWEMEVYAPPTSVEQHKFMIFSTKRKFLKVFGNQITLPKEYSGKLNKINLYSMAGSLKGTYYITGRHLKMKNNKNELLLIQIID